jgi:cellulose synthase/poly-beta-1,6-N-acetylglucosamine synthase-like glycosyltransferase
VEETIQSVYETCLIPFELIVVNDKSTDRSGEILEKLQQIYGFTLVHQTENKGKSRTLNDIVDRAKNETLLLLDADVTANQPAIEDAVLRLESNPKISAVSCPYRPKNKGLLPLMQNIEYNMTSLIKGSYNHFSAITLWGGFLMVRKQSFIECGRFSINAITEDIDLAYKLNEHGWKVEQSFVRVLTVVPDTFKEWFHQKLRWTSGAIQANIAHFKIWRRNPIHMVFFTAYSYLTVSSVFSMAFSYFWIDNAMQLLSLLQGVEIFSGLHITWLLYGPLVLKNLFMKLIFTLYALPYSFPLATSGSEAFKLILIIPFCVTYFPVYIAISILGFFVGVYKYQTLSAKERAW